MANRSIFWFRRDLRLGDNPALLSAIAEGDEVVPVFILDPKLIKTAGSKRLAYLGQSLRLLDESLGNNLHVIAGDQVTVLNDLIKRYQVSSVHISAEYEVWVHVAVSVRTVCYWHSHDAATDFAAGWPGGRGEKVCGAPGGPLGLGA